MSVPAGNRFRQLEDTQILGTLSRLRDRITERFPGSGLAGVADELLALRQASDAAISDLLFLGASVFFLLTLETRLKRRRALAALHQLRSMAHIVDMHQLTKDPDRVASVTTNTASSPVRSLTPMELGRYLDYCSELLSLISKIAALHVQHFNEPVVLGAVNEIETLATGLSGKIWQKISLLNAAAARPG